jgi:hypothetical protein
VPVVAATARGWAVLMLVFHLGDESEFVAEKIA